MEIAGPQPLPSLIRLPGSPVLFSEDSEELQPYSGNTARQLEFLEEMVRENETERQKEATQSETVESVTGSRQKETQQEEGGCSGHSYNTKNGRVDHIDTSIRTENKQIGASI